MLEEPGDSRRLNPFMAPDLEAAAATSWTAYVCPETIQPFEN